MSKPTNVSLSCCPAQIYRSKNCLWDPTRLSSPSFPGYRFSLTSFLYSLPKGMLQHQLPAATKHLLYSPSIMIFYVLICQSNDKIVFRSSLIGAFTLRGAKNLLWATQQQEVLTQNPSTEDSEDQWLFSPTATLPAMWEPTLNTAESVPSLASLWAQSSFYLSIVNLALLSERNAPFLERNHYSHQTLYNLMNWLGRQGLRRS